jgi:hypothetical protein
MVSKFRVIALIFLSLSALLMRPAMANDDVVVVLQAESMPTKTSGEISQGGTAWAIKENGSISQPVTFTKGKRRLEVLARGTYIRDAWPVMQLKVDGAAVGAPITVASCDWSIYAVEALLAAGTRSVSVELTNAYFDREANKYRLLEIDQVSSDQVSSDNVSVPWGLTVVLLGPMDPVQHAEIPVKEAISFIEARTRLVFDVQYVAGYPTYDYTPYRFGPDIDGDGAGDDVAYLMMGWNISTSVIDSLPVTSSYLFLHTMNGLRPLQAGSALGVDYGIWKGGKPRPYSSVPTDQWWYVNEPYGGFASRAAQILTHEIINTIQGRIEAAPYHCPQLTATWGLAPAQFESERLLKLNDACYEKLGNNPD